MITQENEEENTVAEVFENEAQAESRATFKKRWRELTNARAGAAVRMSPSVPRIVDRLPQNTTGFAIKRLKMREKASGKSNL